MMMVVVVLLLCVFSSSLLILGSAENGLSPSLSAVPPVGAVARGSTPDIIVAPTPVPQPNGTGLQPPVVTPPFMPAPVPLLPPSILPGPSTSPPAPIQVSVPSMPPIPSHLEPPPVTVQPPVPPSSNSLPPESTHPTLPGSSLPPNSHQPIVNAPLSPVAPVTNVPAPPESSPPPSHSVEPPSLPPVPTVSTPPTLPGNSAPILNQPPSSPPEQNILAPPPPSINTKTPEKPLAAPANKSAHNYTPPPSITPEMPLPAPANKSVHNYAPPPSITPEMPLPPPANKSAHNYAPPPSITPGMPLPVHVNKSSHNYAPPPSIAPEMPLAAPVNRSAHHYAPVRQSPNEAPTESNPPGKSNNAPPPRLFSKTTPNKVHHAKVYNTTPPLAQGIPPTSGSSASTPPISVLDNPHSPLPAPSPKSPSDHAKTPSATPNRPSPRRPKKPLPPVMHALPPPPPQKDCAPLTCTEPLTYGPHESPCVCVLPVQVGLRLTVALYTFFPLVSELAAEIAAGVFLKQSQVRIMGANAAEENPEKTIVLIDLLPLGEKFDDTTVYLMFQRFWHKQVAIKTLFFGDYDVLYVRYPGLPPSPPLPPSTIGIVSSKPYPGHGNNGRTVQPLGVDVSGRQHKNGFSRGVLATIILSCFVAAILFCAVAWVFLFRSRHCLFQADPAQPSTDHSMAKSSGIPVSMVGSGPSSPSFSLGSSIAAYTGSAKTFILSDIEKATNFFDETRVLGEGGFGRVYSGVLVDGTQIAVKILKRYDQQGGREFLAEVEMLSRLHHRNLVKLIGICAEDRIRCLVYELIPNGSVESHLHGIDKERSSLDWSSRLKIALGAARALAYLHEDSSPPVIHRDFKASNILLEDDFTPKVSDFGLARAALNEENRHISTRVMGTFGYVAPEYAMTGHLLVKSDVYSYGVVLLELLSGRKPVDMSQPSGQENLVSWARPLLTSREGLEVLVDQSLGPDFPYDSIAKVAAIASMCVQPEVSHRPFMGEVVQALKLVCNECEQLREAPSRTGSQEDLCLVTDTRTSTNNLDRMLTPSTMSDYDYRLDVERDVSMSELLGSSGVEDSESFRRYSTSGPLVTGRRKPLWKSMRQLSRGSFSENFRLWPGSH